MVEMTILPKKKPQKSDEAENTHSNNLNIGVSLNNVAAHSQVCERSLEDCIGDGQCNWVQEKRSSSESVENNANGGIRRLRASPLRTCNRSSKIRDRPNSSPTSWGLSSNTSNTSPKPGPSSRTDEDVSAGYNSGDEYGSGGQCSDADWLERDRLFEKRMKKRGFIVKHMKEDGSCLFRAVSDQVYGDQEMHDTVRTQCMDYITVNRDHYSQYMTEDFDSYVDRKRLHRTHGNHIEIQAMCEMYNRPIEVFCYSKDQINIYHDPKNMENPNEPIRLSYQRGSHYNSIVDPHKATIGVGLGLPNFSPGSADRNLLSDALRKSEESEIEKTMLEDKLRATDWETTNELIEEQVARESYLQWFKDNEKHKRNQTNENSPSRAGSSKTTATTTYEKLLDENANPNLSSEVASSSPSSQYRPSDFHINEQASFLNQFPPEMFGINDWNDIDILSQVLASSQEEYLENLKKQNIKDKEEKEKIKEKEELAETEEKNEAKDVTEDKKGDDGSKEKEKEEKKETRKEINEEMEINKKQEENEVKDEENNSDKSCSQREIENGVSLEEHSVKIEEEKGSEATEEKETVKEVTKDVKEIAIDEIIHRSEVAKEDSLEIKKNDPDENGN